MKLALIGVGLIGGSFARAALSAGAVTSVVGFDADAAALSAALRIGAITTVAESAQAAVGQADLVMLAVPVGAMAAVMKEIAPHLRADAIVTDVGSTKASVVSAARAELGAHFRRFVPGHPIAGRERPGVESSDARLFDGRLFITTPVAETDPAAMHCVESLWQRLGARVERMDEHEHDRVFAAVSHLPHLAGLRARCADRARGRRGAQVSQGGRGFSRLHAHRGIEPADVARRLRRESRVADG